MFFTIGISYILMSSPLLLRKRLSLNLNYIQLFINQSLLITGCISLVLGILNLLFSHLIIIWSSTLALMICIVGMLVITKTQNYIKSLEVMRNFE